MRLSAEISRAPSPPESLRRQGGASPRASCSHSEELLDRLLRSAPNEAAIRPRTLTPLSLLSRFGPRLTASTLFADENERGNLAPCGKDCEAESLNCRL